MFRRIAILALILVLVYMALGVASYVGWKNAAAVCREERIARGEFVEPNKVLGDVIGLAFDVTFWPVYAAANLRLGGKLSG